MTSSEAPAPAFGQTVTILFSDIRGFTDFTDSHGDTAAYGVLREYNALIQEQVDRTAGHVVKTQGDSWMIAFDSARTALTCAVGMQRALENHGSSVPLQLGIGINSGEPVRESADFFGGTVNLAARICAAAGPGQILVSDTTRQLVGKLDDAAFVDHGHHRLKGFLEPQHLYELDWNCGGARAQIRTEAVSTVRRPVRRIGLIPLAAILVLVLAGAGGFFFGIQRNPSDLAADDFTDTSKALFLDNQQGTFRFAQLQVPWTYAYQNGALVAHLLPVAGANGGDVPLGPKTQARGEFSQDVAAEVTAAATIAPEQAYYGLDYDPPGGTIYRFVASPGLTQYTLSVLSGGAPRILARGRTNIIQSGTSPNVLRFEVRGNTMHLLINGNEVNVARDDGMTVRPAGIGIHFATTGAPAEREVEIRFTHFRVTAL